MRRLALLAIASLALVACDDATDDTAVAPIPEPAPPSEGDPEPLPEREPGPVSLTDAQRTMHDRYDAALAIRGALVRGALEEAKAVARTMGPVAAELPDEARGMRDLVPERAAAIVRAEELDPASRAFGATVQACGACHGAASVSFTVEPTPAPSGESLQAHMARHQWAVDRMWEGLVTGEAARFDEGLAALGDAPLHGDEAGEDPDAVHALEARVHALAVDEGRRASMEARGELFGELLVTCASCHRHFQALEQRRVE